MIRERRLVPGQVPDPLRAHGAWVYLLVSILAGAAVARGDLLPALLAGSAFVGVFFLAGSLAIAGRRTALARFFVGVVLAIGAPLLALRLGADRSFLLVGLAAVPFALVAAWFAAGDGFLSPGALSCGVTALTVSAAVAAIAADGPARSAVLIFVVLAPFFCWRTWILARALGDGWTRSRFRRRGLIESGLAVAWAALAVAVTRLLG